MAQAAGKLEIREESATLGRVVPMRGGPSRTAAGQELKEWSATGPSMRERLDVGKQWASYALLSAKQSVVELYRTTRRRASHAYIDVSSASRNLTTRARCRAKQIKKEHPVQLLAVVAGTALILGIVARVWRSRHHA